MGCWRRNFVSLKRRLLSADQRRCSETVACLRMSLAWSSNDISSEGTSETPSPGASRPPLPARAGRGLTALRAHLREEDHVPNARRVGQQHRQEVDAEAFTAGGGATRW